MFGEDREQPQDGVVLLLGQRLRVKVGVLELAQIDLRAPLPQLLRERRELPRARLADDDFAGLEKAEQPLARAHRDARFVQSGKTHHTPRPVRRGIGSLLLRVEAGGARGRDSGEHRAERIIAALAVVGETPAFHRSQSERQPRRFR